MSDLPANEFEGIYQNIRDILLKARHQAMQAVNAEMVRAYWEIGRVIVEQEQQGKARADYGARMIESLSARLTQEFGRGFTLTNLKYMRQFYTLFPIGHALRGELSWTHYRLLLKVEKPEARQFYEEETVRQRWSTRELERQIGTLYYERVLLSRDKMAMLQQETPEAERFQIADIIKDPFVLEFTGLPERGLVQESTLEDALISHLQQFLLEMGGDLLFAARQKRITVDGDTFFVDLVFYHRMLNCFVLIDLKTRKLTHEDIGQMLFYLGWYEQEETRPEENPPIGLLLCADKNDAVVRYTLSQSRQSLFASRYQFHLPDEATLRAEIERERARWELEQNLRDENNGS
jgi:predicted nuclease of restriction endonuclease-like (RecB) superfamily